MKKHTIQPQKTTSVFRMFKPLLTTNLTHTLHFGHWLPFITVCLVHATHLE